MFPYLLYDYHWVNIISKSTIETLEPCPLTHLTLKLSSYRKQSIDWFLYDGNFGVFNVVLLSLFVLNSYLLSGFISCDKLFFNLTLSVFIMSIKTENCCFNLIIIENFQIKRQPFKGNNLKGSF